MGNFNQGGDRGDFRSGGRDGQRDFGRPNFPKKEWDGRHSGSKEPMKYQATCSDCGKRCEVPFRPVSGKPVFCNDCFSGKRATNTGGDRVPAKIHYGNKSGDNGNGVKRELLEMNMKLDRLIKAVEAFTGANVQSVTKAVPKEGEKKSVDVASLKKALEQATEHEAPKTKAEKKDSKPTKKAAILKKKK